MHKCTRILIHYLYIDGVLRLYALAAATAGREHRVCGVYNKYGVCVRTCTYYIYIIRFIILKFIFETKHGLSHYTRQRRRCPIDRR